MNHSTFPLEDGVALSLREVTKPEDPDGLILESWAQGFMVGSLVIMSCITLANMKRKVLLHKLILIELLFGVWHGFFIFFDTPIYNWWLSISAIFLNASWSLHNVIAWIKNKPFLSRQVSLIYIGTVILVQPYWVLEIYANFAYFHNVNTIFLKTRPLEALFRDPWWIFTTISLFYNIKTRYEMSIGQIVKLSPRFAVMLVAMVLSIIFLILDICSVTGALSSSLPVGINPFWKLSFVFKCLTDSVVLDDFKTALDRLRNFQIHRFGSLGVEDASNGVINASQHSAHGQPLFGVSRAKGAALKNPPTTHGETFDPKIRRKRPQWDRVDDDDDIDVEMADIDEDGGRTHGRSLSDALVTRPQGSRGPGTRSPDLAYAAAVRETAR